MSKLPDFFNSDKNDADGLTISLVDLSAVRDKLDPSKWTEETEPVIISTAEMLALLYAAVARGVDEGEARFLGGMLAEAPPEQLPGLRLAVAHALAVGPRARNSYDYQESIGGIAISLSRALRVNESDKYKTELAAHFDWPVIAKRNSDRKRQEAVTQEAQRCWRACVPPTSDEVRTEMIAHQRRERDRLRAAGLSDDDIRLEQARRGYGYDDGDFFLTDRWAVVRELMERQKAIRIRAVLDDPAFGEDEGDGPILGYYDPDTGLLPAYPGGGILEVIGPAQNYKTTLVARLCCAALARDADLKVLYLAGELPAHVRRLRDAYGAEDNLTATDVKARFHVHNGMPAMHDPANADRVLHMVEMLGVNIVVLDTWARAIAGLREITDAPGDMLAEAGQIGRIAALGVLVVIVGHCPLSQEKRLRGNSSADNASDARLWVVGSAKGFKVEVLKMRPVPPGHTVYGSVPPVPRNLSPTERTMLPPPVITWCAKGEYDKAVHDPRQRTEEPLSRAEKARLRAQRNRDARSQQKE